MKSGKIRQGEAFSFSGLRIDVIAGSEDSPVTVLEMTVTPKFGAPPHISFDEDKIFLISEGALRFTIDDVSFDATAGERVAVKAGAVHGFVNLGSTDAVQTLVSTPARHERFLRALADLAQPVDPGELEKVCVQFNQKIVGPLATA